MSTRLPYRLAAARINERSADIVFPSLPISLPVIEGSHVTETRQRPGWICCRSNCNESASLARILRMYSARLSAAVESLTWPEKLRGRNPPPPGLPLPPPFLKGLPLYRLAGRRFSSIFPLLLCLTANSSTADCSSRALRSACHHGVCGYRQQRFCSAVLSWLQLV